MKLFLASFLALPLITLSAPLAAFAATDWDALSPGDFFYETHKAVLAIEPTEFSTLSGAVFQKKPYEEAIDGYYQVTTEGIAADMGASYVYQDGHISAAYEYGDAKKGRVFPIETITIKDKIYLMFPDAQPKALQGKWIPLSGEQYNALGTALDLQVLFDEGVSSVDKNELAFVDTYVTLAKKHTLYEFAEAPIEDSYDVEDATRYDLVLRRDHVVAFYQALQKTLNEKQRELSILSWKGFPEALKKSAFVDQIVADSYRSVWIDDETKLPVRIVDIYAVPAIAKKDKYTLIVNDSEFKEKTFEEETAPSDIISFGQAVKALKLKLKAPEELEIAKLLKAVKKQKANTDKAKTYEAVAELYKGLTETKKAAEHYRKAASYSPKGTTEYYRLLKLAEQMLGNTKKEKEFATLEESAA